MLSILKDDITLYHLLDAEGRKRLTDSYRNRYSDDLLKLFEIITERSFSYLLAGINDDILSGKCKSDIINYCGE